MKRVLALTVLSSVLGLFVMGCAASESAASGGTETPVASGENAELAKCEFCGAEMPKSQLAMHDGKLACSKCIESHNH